MEIAGLRTDEMDQGGWRKNDGKSERRRRAVIQIATSITQALSLGYPGS